ncbi:alpha-hydroxy-acid oxidizing protein [Kerstersia sp.]|uniref:alpha-hydroxy-acid oxidizing protein n=1 Tax=Kerstersia sp. TaxID=1930783 RepID=UPI003F93E076
MNITALREKAKRRLPRAIFDYVDGGAEDEQTLADNLASFADWRFVPSRLTDLRALHPETTLLGGPSAFPAAVAPTGLNGLLWPDGDIALARAAQRAGIPFMLSTASNAALEEVARQAGGRLWFQLYVVEQELALSLVRRAREADYECLAVTVDVVANGKRERDVRNGFRMPPRYTPAMVLDGLLHPRWTWNYLRHGMPALGNFQTPEAQSPQARAALLRRSMDAGFSWQALEAVRQAWPRKLIVKGVLDPQDVLRCRAMGVDAVVLSNHGGRQLDSAWTGMEALAALQGMDLQGCEIMVDGGVRRGSHMAKAVAFGASGVLLGRAALYGLASGGEDGALDALHILRDEYLGTLTHLGCGGTAALDAGFVAQRRG